MSKVKRLLLWIAVLYPVSWIVQKLSKIPVFDLYNEFLHSTYEFIYEWWDWLLIAGVSYVITKSIVEVKYETMELIRRNRFKFEIARWSDTPYAPPVLFFYLINPPQSVSMQMGKEIENRFYQMVVNYFRDRVFINAEYHNQNPQEREPQWKIVGLKDISKTIMVFLIVFIWFAKVSLMDLSSWINGWERFTIPAVLYFSLYVALKIHAYYEMSYRNLDQVLGNTFGEPEPRILWRELFPDQHKGETLLSAWEAEREKRQRYTLLYRSGFVPEKITIFDSLALAPYPYPYEGLPKWVDDMEAHYQEKVKGWAAHEATKPQKPKNKGNGNIVEFKAKRKQSN